MIGNTRPQHSKSAWLESYAETRYVLNNILSWLNRKKIVKTSIYFQGHSECALLLPAPTATLFDDFLWTPRYEGDRSTGFFSFLHDFQWRSSGYARESRAVSCMLSVHFQFRPYPAALREMPTECALHRDDSSSLKKALLLDAAWNSFVK